MLYFYQLNRVHVKILMSILHDIVLTIPARLLKHFCNLDKLPCEKTNTILLTLGMLMAY